MKQLRPLLALTITLGLLGLTSCGSMSTTCATCCGVGTAKKECCVKAGGECTACAAKKAAAKKS